jgi:hypothetical protein
MSRSASMFPFLLDNRDELIARCEEKVALRPHHAISADQLALGVPLFLEQLIRTLGAERDGEGDESLRISGSSSGDAPALSEIGVSALAHGRVLLNRGFSIDQVVHGYGDLCQSITDLAFERDAPFSIDEFRTLNRCLDNAIADAVSGFAGQRDDAISLQTSADENERLGLLIRELRNYLHTAMMAFSALEAGNLSIGSSTATLMKWSLTSLESLITESISDLGLSVDHSADESSSRDATMTMRTTVTARALNEMIQAHIDSRLLGTYLWHSGVYLHPTDPTGCNWNIAINCKEDVPSCGAVVSGYLDELRHRFVIAENDVDALPAYVSGRARDLETRHADARHKVVEAAAP